MNKQKLQEEYPYLDNIWRAYEDYDNAVNAGNDLYLFYLKDVTYTGEKNNYTNICVKLLRNLTTLLGDTYKGLDKYEYCIYLYHWVYHRIKKSDIPGLLLSSIFNEFESKKLEGKTNMCPYAIYENISKESDEIIKLNIFNRNINTIRGILMNQVQSKNCKFQEFIHNCVNIYNKVNNKYCKPGIQKNEPNEDICSIVREFSSGYTSYILEKQKEIKIKLPSLSNTDSEGHPITNIDGCPSYGNQEESHSNNNDQPDSTVLHNVPKILGTMAGISSIIAMSYKFTPFRKLFQLRRGAASLSNSLNEKESINLINNESDPWNGSSNNTKYNIGYGSV
ncbi:hypothetical protein PVT01_030029900 [Plasmodium vivax]|uniref:VIR protein n=1 Tax=Plasmodium vivax TaxID=5855 RepID=A0A1G4GSB2_PLAVI|nr:hypothetical protein PVT01_030029900 [Plasmodium vivax]